MTEPTFGPGFLSELCASVGLTFDEEHMWTAVYLCDDEEDEC